MTPKGLKPEQGQLYAQAMTYLRQLDLEHLRRINQYIDTEIIRKKVSRKP